MLTQRPVLGYAGRPVWHHHFASKATAFPTALMVAQNLPDERPPARPIRLPFTTSDPLAKHRAVTGINAHVRWYQRVGSLAGIAALVVLIGVLLAGSVGVAFIAARIILELLVG